MAVEMRREDRSEAAPGPAEAAEGERGAAALRDLVAARLVDHEAIGDPGRLAGEAAALNGLCGLVAGPVYRLGPFHYAFAARDADLGGRLAGLAGPARTAALAVALADALGPEAVWLGPADLADAVEAEAEEAAAALPAAALLVLRAGDAATGQALAAAGPGLSAVIDARFAAEAARRAGDLAEALGLEAAIRAATAAVDRRVAALETLLEAGLAARGAAEAAAAAAHAAEARAFEARIGLALAEFLARLERRAEGAGAP